MPQSVSLNPYQDEYARIVMDHMSKNKKSVKKVTKAQHTKAVKDMLEQYFQFGDKGRLKVRRHQTEPGIFIAVPEMDGMANSLSPIVAVVRPEVVLIPETDWSNVVEKFAESISRRFENVKKIEVSQEWRNCSRTNWIVKSMPRPIAERLSVWDNGLDMRIGQTMSVSSFSTVNLVNGTITQAGIDSATQDIPF